MSAEQQVSFKKKYKAPAIAGSCILYFLAFPVGYAGVTNDNPTMMILGLGIVAVGIILDIVFG